MAPRITGGPPGASVGAVVPGKRAPTPRDHSAEKAPDPVRMAVRVVRMAVRVVRMAVRVVRMAVRVVRMAVL